MTTPQPPIDLLDDLPGMAYRALTTTPRRLLFASEGCLVLTGHTSDEFVGDPGVVYGDLIHPEDRATTQEEIDAAIQENRPYHCTYRLITADGEERWVNDSGRPTPARDSDQLFLTGFVRDAQEEGLILRQAERRLADQERKLSALHDILEALSTPDDLLVILEKSLKAGLQAARGDGGFIHLREKSSGNMRLVVRHEIPDSAAERIGFVSGDDGLVAWVARQREPLLIPHIGRDPRTVYLAALGDLKVYAGVPISNGHQVWGTLSVLGRDPSQFGEQEVALLVSIGEEIGFVIENARLRLQAKRLVLVQERNRLAHELHDSVTQSLYSVTLFAEAGRRTALDGRREESVDYFTRLGETGQQALKEMRLLIHNLRPSILAQEGLVRALQQRLNSVERRAGVKSQLLVEGESKLSPLLEDALYLIAQEALNNALKHAMASEVIVRLNILNSEEVILLVEDNGQGFDPETAAESDGVGLTSMAERAKSFDGQFNIRTTRGQGTIVEARLRNSAQAATRPADLNLEDLL